MKKTPEKKCSKYDEILVWDHKYIYIYIYVWTIKNPFLITKTYENNENTSNFQF